MKTTIKPKLVGVAFAAASLVSMTDVHADVTLFIEGGSASQSVLYDRATNLYASGSFTSTGTSSSTVRRFSGSSLNPALSGFGTITIDINVNNGAIAGLQNLVTQNPGPGDTNILGVPTVPTFVDSATSPEAVGISSVAANLSAYPTYVVPLIYVKNTNFADLASVTNLTQRQAWSLENSTLPTIYFGGSSTNNVYFIGRNSEAAVRTEIDLSIYNTQTINTYYTNGVNNTPILDTSADPGLSSGGTVASTVLAVTDSIGTIAVQNLKTGLGALSFEGVPYSVSNIINGSYPLWGYENYYFITAPNNGAPTSPQQAVLNAFYQSVTNSTFWTNVVFTNNFIPNPLLEVYRNFDGGQIYPYPNY